jgi:predicted dehydrogenase
MVTQGHELSQRFVPDPGAYVWQQGATVISESLINGTEPLIAAEHALHVLEIIEAARESGAIGRRISLKSTFKWPII